MKTAYAVTCSRRSLCGVGEYMFETCKVHLYTPDVQLLDMSASGYMSASGLPIRLVHKAAAGACVCKSC